MSPYQRMASGPIWRAIGIELRMNEHREGGVSATACAKIAYADYTRLHPPRRANAGVPPRPPHPPPRPGVLPHAEQPPLQAHHRRASPARPTARCCAPSGFSDGDFDKPIVGVANGHSHDEPVQRRHPAAGRPRRWRRSRTPARCRRSSACPTVTDGIGMGTEGMKYSLVSREVIADAIETAVNGQRMDGVLVVGGCDKNMPGGMMAMARMNVPGIFVYAGTIKPGHWKGQDAHHRQPVRGGRRVHRRQDVEGGLRRHREKRLPVGRRLRRHVHRQHHVLVVRGAGHEPARLLADGLARRGEGRLARPSRRACWSTPSKSDLKPRDIITRKSIENAVALVMATGGSTNAVLHYPRDRRCGRGQVDHRRLRARAPQRAGAVRSQALGPVRRDRFPPRRRRAAGAEDAARRTACCTATA